MKKLETGVMANLWYKILTVMNNTSKMLQKPTLDINSAVSMLSSLHEFISSLHLQFDLFVILGIELTTISSFQMVRKRKAFQDEIVDDTELSARENFKVQTFNVIINKLTCAITFRIKAYGKVSGLFGFLSKLEYIDEQDLRRAAETLVCTYQCDLEISLTDKLVQFAFLMRTPLAKQLREKC